MKTEIVTVSYKDKSISFIKDERLALPIKFAGELLHIGWDIPTVWAVDNENQFYRNCAHGDALVITKNLPSDDDPEIYRYFASLVGKEVPAPDWVYTAIRNGWTAPDEWFLEKKVHVPYGVTLY